MRVQLDFRALLAKLDYPLLALLILLRLYSSKPHDVVGVECEGGDGDAQEERVPLSRHVLQDRRRR